MANACAQIDAFDQSDFILARGTCLGDIPAQGYMFPALPQPRQTLLHCHPDMPALRVTHIDEIDAALSQGMQADEPMFIEVQTSLTVVLPRASDKSAPALSDDSATSPRAPAAT